MQNQLTTIILKTAQLINPQIGVERKFTINPEQLRRLPEGTLGYEVARFLDDNGLEPLNSGDWVQRSHDVFHVLSGLSPSEHDEFMLQAFTRAQFFRPSSTILVLVGLLTLKINLPDIIKGFKSGRRAKNLMEWDIEANWQTSIDEARQKLGIVPLNSLNSHSLR